MLAKLENGVLCVYDADTGRQVSVVGGQMIQLELDGFNWIRSQGCWVK